MNERTLLQLSVLLCKLRLSHELFDTWYEYYGLCALLSCLIEARDDLLLSALLVE